MDNEDVRFGRGMVAVDTSTNIRGSKVYSRTLGQDSFLVAGNQFCCRELSKPAGGRLSRRRVRTVVHYGVLGLGRIGRSTKRWSP